MSRTTERFLADEYSRVILGVEIPHATAVRMQRDADLRCARNLLRAAAGEHDPREKVRQIAAAMARIVDAMDEHEEAGR
jgi:hypothetical protein